MRHLLAALCCVFPLSLSAQEAPNTILVLDGSGSMWGQIDGVNKIVIARDVVGTLLNDFPQDQNLGLTVYGHRTRGDCTDIETVVAPGAGTLPAIREAVNGINPRGRTPMTDAIIAAAQALRYTEEPATVVLVSDGIETCNPDPCAAALALEEAGIDFTAHVVGFDVTDPEALAQMQCIAGNTGGQFLEAANAAELSTALTQVAVAPEPIMGRMAFVARAGEGGPVLDDVAWAVTPMQAEGAVTFAGSETLTLEEGDYTLIAVWPETEERIDDGFEVTADGGVVEVVFEPLPEIVPVTFRAVLDTEDGPLVTGPVEWILPEADLAGIGNPFETDLMEGSHTVTAYWVSAEATSEPRQFIALPGGREVVVVFEEPPLTAAVTAPDSAVAGSTIEVAWDGPNEDGDYIGVGEVGAEGTAQWENFVYVEDGSPASLLIPATPGDYLITYYLRDGRQAIGSAPLTVTPVSATLSAPAEGAAGSVIELAWTGPDYEGDYLGIGEVGAEGTERWENFVYTEDGSPTTLLVPAEPGDYEITYFMRQDRTPVTSVALTVTELSTSITAPETAVIGSEIEVAWTGPDYEDDYIGIGKVGATSSGQWESFAYTAAGSPTTLRMPVEPGEYVITYFVAQDRTALASSPITLTALTTSVTAPATAVAGASIEVAWTGPGYDGDYIGIGLIGATSSGQWDNFAYTEEGSPLRLLTPPRAGEYEIGYFIAQDRTKETVTRITLTAPSAAITAPAEAVQGSTIEIAWDGPAYDGDYIGIGRVGATSSGQWENFVYMEDGSPAQLVIPPTSGDFELSYFIGQDRTKLMSVPIAVTPVEVSMAPPATVSAGSLMEVSWSGPNYEGDYLGLGIEGASSSGQWQSFAYTADGSPAQIQVPDAPGRYVLKYFIAQDRTAVGEVVIEVQ
ncbi:MAG: VWA domain-containing protein [Pseudomonadota bacterium]